MFSLQHFIWLAICIALIVFSSIMLFRKRPSIKDVLTVCCIISLASEAVKVFGTIEIVPTMDGSMYFPYLEAEHAPLHLCSLQIITIFLARFTKNPDRRTSLLAFLSTTAPLGAAFALALPSILGSSVPVSQAFIHPLAYQTFIYHAMLVVLGIYIYFGNEVQIRSRHYWMTLGVLGLLAFLSLYINSIFGTAVYVNDKLVAVEHTTNFLFTYLTPIGLMLTKKWHWLVYISIIAALAVVLIGIMYIPVFLRERKERKSA